MDIAIEYRQEFSLVRYLDNGILPVQFTLFADVMPTDNVQNIDFDIAFAKIRFWFDVVVTRAIVFSRTDTDLLDILLDDQGKPRVMNHLMIAPEAPHDEHLAALFQSKMMALSKSKLLFGGVRLESSASTGTTFTYLGDWHEDLPSMEDWFAVKPYYFDQPWWARDDASTLDLLPAGDDIDFGKRPLWAFTLDHIEEAIRPKAPEKTYEDVVIRGAFKPKVINGGKEQP